MRPLAVVSCALLATFLAGACERVEFEPGTECELNTDCVFPFVCRLGRCRVECRGQRDCGAGLQCVRDEDGLGACQLESETECRLTSDCEDYLVCRFQQCTNACEVDRDCFPGSRCLEEPGGGRGCHDGSEIECEIDSDCTHPLICANDERCRPECQGPRDCELGWRCATELDPAVCMPPVTPDAGPDAGTDGGDTDAGIDVDAGTDDGGTTTVIPPAPPTMAAGELHTCVRAAPSDSVYCWGDNSWAQVDGSGITPRPSPIAVGPTAVTIVGAGAEHSCAASGAQLLCWGYNDSGQIGVGTPSATTPVSTPTAVPGLSGTLLDVSLGSDHTCALTTAGLYCWGDNTYGQLGDGTFSPRTSPGAPITLAGAATAVTTHGFHTCALLMSGEVQCFGRNDDGQLGVGDTVDHATPVTIDGITDAAQVATGTRHTCVLHTTGAVDCFGADHRGQLGDGPPLVPQDRPSRVVGLGEPARELTLGSAHTCARTDAEVYCWGDNLFGQGGVDPLVAGALVTATPIGAGAVAEIEAGTTHTCYRNGTGYFCFGRNNQGQLGFGATTPARQHVAQAVAF